MLKAERDVAVRSWRRDAVKKHRSKPYAIWPHRACGSGWTPSVANALRWNIGDDAFNRETFRPHSVFLTPPLCKDFWPPRHSPLVLATHGHRQWCEIIDYACPGLDCAIHSVFKTNFLSVVSAPSATLTVAGGYVASDCHTGGAVSIRASNKRMGKYKLLARINVRLREVHSVMENLHAPVEVVFVHACLNFPFLSPHGLLASSNSYSHTVIGRMVKKSTHRYDSHKST